jgi:hypothetical protein
VVAGGAGVHPLVFIRWAERGVWERLFDLVQQRGRALGMVFVDGTIIRAQHKAAGAKIRGPAAASEIRERDHCEALGRSRGGFGTKARVIADGRGRAVGFALAGSRSPVRARRFALAGSRSPRAKHTKRRWLGTGSPACPPRREGWSAIAAWLRTICASTSGISARAP